MGQWDGLLLFMLKSNEDFKMIWILGLWQHTFSARPEYSVLGSSISAVIFVILFFGDRCFVFGERDVSCSLCVPLVLVTFITHCVLYEFCLHSSVPRSFRNKIGNCCLCWCDCPLLLSQMLNTNAIV